MELEENLAKLVAIAESEEIEESGKVGHMADALGLMDEYVDPQYTSMGYAAGVHVDLCQRCGVVVGYPGDHSAYHRNLTSQVQLHYWLVKAAHGRIGEACVAMVEGLTQVMDLLKEVVPDG